MQIVMCKYAGCDKLAYPHRMYLIDRDEVDAKGKPVYTTKMVEGKDINWTAKHGFCGPVHCVPYMTEKSLWSIEPVEE